jgi:hypothetical protein
MKTIRFKTIKRLVKDGLLVKDGVFLRQDYSKFDKRYPVGIPPNLLHLFDGKYHEIYYEEISDVLFLVVYNNIRYVLPSIWIETIKNVDDELSVINFMI